MVSCTNGKIHFHQKVLPMKKHLFLTFLFALASTFLARAQALAYPGTTTPEEAVLQIRQVAEQHLPVYSSREHGNGRNCCDGNKCQKQKKSKKHHHCKQRGNHYGKHKNRHDRHSCSCDHDDKCQSGERRDRDDDRRYGSDRRERDDDDNQQRPRTGQRNPQPKVKTRPTPNPKPTSTRPGARRQ